MPKNKVSEWSSTAANNTDIGSIDIAEGCAPSGINNAIREMMAQVKDMQAGTDSDNFTVGGNLNVTGTTTATGGVTGNVTGNLISVTNTITSGSFIVGNTYTIATLGTTDFTLIGSSANTVGVEFTATGVGTGTGTATTVTGRAVTISSVLPVTKGGTGNSSAVPNAVAVGGSTSTSSISAVRPSTIGNVLTSTAGSTITAESFVVGVEYSILTIGTTDFTLIGASSNTVGVVFTATGGGTGNGTAQITTWTSAHRLTSATAQSSTSGTSIDFTGIPSWVKRITVMFAGVSTNGTSDFIIQLGDAGGFETTGYSGCAAYNGSASGSAATFFSAGFGFITVAAGNIVSGNLIINLLDSATKLWSANGSLAGATTYIGSYAGSKSLSDVLTQLRITTVNGTDTFDAGSINIMYE